jgi:hypothetical protein
MKKSIVCPRCLKPFKTRQGLGNHLRYCETVKDRPTAVQPSPAEPAQARPIPSAESISSKRQWDPDWSDFEKRAYLADEAGLKFSAIKGRVVVVVDGKSYSEAVVDADRQKFLYSLRPRRPSRPEPTEDTDDSLLATLLLLTMMSR